MIGKLKGVIDSYGEDAVILDSTAMSLEEVLERAEEIVRAHLPPA